MDHYSRARDNADIRRAGIDRSIVGTRVNLLPLSDGGNDFRITGRSRHGKASRPREKRKKRREEGRRKKKKKKKKKKWKEDPTEFRRCTYDHVAFLSREFQARYIKLNCKYRAEGVGEGEGGRVKDKSTASAAQEHPPRHNWRLKCAPHVDECW